MWPAALHSNDPMISCDNCADQFNGSLCFGGETDSSGQESATGSIILHQFFHWFVWIYSTGHYRRHWFDRSTLFFARWIFVINIHKNQWMKLILLKYFQRVLPWERTVWWQIWPLWRRCGTFKKILKKYFKFKLGTWVSKGRWIINIRVIKKSWKLTKLWGVVVPVVETCSRWIISFQWEGPKLALKLRFFSHFPVSSGGIDESSASL